jgi:peptide/nickel transport system substrate-binding protein
MISTRKPVIALAGIAIAALGLTACSAGGGGGTTPSDDADAPELSSTGWTRADYDEVQDGGTLTLPIDTAPANWNLYNLDSGTVDDNLLSTLFVPGFITIGEDGTWETNEDYATRVELVSEDPQVVEVDINPEAVWSDGTPITVADVAANFNALNGTNPDFAPTATNVWEDIASVEQGDDERQAVITFANTNADWPSILGGIYPQWLMATPESFNTAWASGPFAADGTTYVSGGPFIVTDFDANAQVVTFGPNPAWWGQAPKLESITFQAVSRDGLSQAFANNELDAFNLYGSADNLQTAEGRGDAVIERSLGTTYRHVTLNGTSEVFSDPLVREAFGKALDRTVLAQAILGGVESPVELLNNLIYLPGQDGYVDNAGESLNADVDGARALLEEAGATFDGDEASIDGTPLEVRFVIPSDNPNSANIATLVQQQTAPAGFAVDIQVVPSDDFFTEYITTETRDFDATYFAWQGTAFPVSSTRSIFYPADSGQNFPGITDESLGDDWNAANAELDPEARLELANGIDEKIVALYSTIPLFPEPYAWGVRDDLVNYGPAQFEVPDWTTVGYTG